MNIQQAKIEVRKKIGKVAKDAKQDFRGYNYTSHEGVTEAVVPAMHKIGMTHTPSCESFEMHDGFAVVRVAVKFWGPDGDSEEVSAYSAEAGVTSDQLDTRLTKEGYANLDEVPLSVLTQWIEKIKESM